MKKESCPLCGNAITSDQLEQIKEKLSEDHRKAAEANEKELRKRLAEEHKKELGVQRAKFESESRKQLDVANKQIGKLTKELSELTAAQATTRKELENAANAKVDAEKKKMAAEKKDELLEQRRLLVESNDKKLAEKSAEHRRKDEAMQKQLDAFKRKLEEKTANQLGDGAEINLFDELRREFPEDKLTPIEKGKKGADVVQDVQHNGQVCGRIIYDSKNCLNWQKAWVGKLRDDKVDSSADHAIISSTVFPPGGHRDLYVENDLIVVNPCHAIYVARLLRNSLIQLHKTSASEQDRVEKTRLVYEFIKSPQFKNRLDQISALASEMEILHEEEIASHNRTWKKRGIQITQLSNNVRDLDLEIAKIIEGHVSSTEFDDKASTLKGTPAQPR